MFYDGGLRVSGNFNYLNRIYANLKWTVGNKKCFFLKKTSYWCGIFTQNILLSNILYTSEEPQFSRFCKFGRVQAFIKEYCEHIYIVMNVVLEVERAE